MEDQPTKISQDSQPRCFKCKHLASFHNAEDGCFTWLLGIAMHPIYRCACIETSVTLQAQRPKYPMNPLAQPVGIAHLPSAFEASKGKYKMSQISVDVRAQIDILYQKLAMLETTVAKNQGLEEELLIGLKAFSSLLSGVIVYRSRDL